MEYQHTLAREFSLSGVGLHTGCRSRLTISPAPPHAGLSFVLSDGSRIPAVPDAVRSTERCTTLGSATAQVHTVEHVLAALVGMDVDNAILSLDGEEVPIMDGSALPFAQAIDDAGVAEQRVPRSIFEPQAPYSRRDGDKLVVIVPALDFRVNFFVSFPKPVGIQFIQTPTITPDYFLREIAPNRTFGFRAEVENLYARGLALGGSLDNAVVIEGDGYMGPLRFSDEIVRHKVLDLMGDFALLGARPRCEIIALKSGHALHVGAVRELRTPLRAASGAR
ncbi:MAG: UDP-3-O-[3-hydroxymyristoyl] N-acetylglucosamine deacetylase [Candidatus Eremiobacteraeota bacterium]|nr:UDP-3-O-[3-hydroxymyristoyl] N-acetylglucosamine deacetylase [Candidatus Eremiobacteraeota bacterium]